LRYISDLVCSQARAPLDAVARQRERGAGETDDRDRIVEAGAGRADDVHHEAEAADVGELADPAHVPRLADGVVDYRPLAGGELQLEAHRLEDRQQVAEDDRRIDAEPLHGGDHHLGREPRVLAQLHEAHLLAHRPVLGEVAARLPHQPDRRPLDRLAATGPHHQGATARIGRGGW
jgi:hypothetical protein